MIKDVYAALETIKARGTTVLLVEQDLSAALKAADRVYCFMEGRVSSGPARGAEPRRDPGRLFRRARVSFLNALIQGALLGGLYALYAAGLALIFGVMRLVNLAHGDFIVLAAYLLLALTTNLFLPAWVAILIAMPFMFALGWGLQRLILNRTLEERPAGAAARHLRPLDHHPERPAAAVLGRQPPAQPRRAGNGVVDFGEISVGVVPLMTFVAAVLVIVGLTLLFYRTSLGRTLRATSDSTEVVQLMGVDPRKVFAIAMGISFVVILIAAFFMGVRANFDPSAGPSRLLYAFEAVVIGGLGSFWGTLIGGVILGVAQTIGATINPEWQQLAGHIVFLAIILVRPRGLLRERLMRYVSTTATQDLRASPRVGPRASW